MTAQADIEAKRTPTLPLAEHVGAALEMHWRWMLNGPPRDEKWTTATWGLVRTLRGHPDLRELSGGEALAALEAVVASWPREGDEAPLAYWTGGAEAEVQSEIVFAWDAVKYAAGWGPLDAAHEMAKRTQLPMSPQHHGGDTYAAFIATAGWLQVLAGEKDIFIPCHTFGRLLKVSPDTVSRWRKIANTQGYLVPRKLSTGRHEADEFHFVIDRFPALVSAAEERAKRPRFSS